MKPCRNCGGPRRLYVSPKGAQQWVCDACRSEAQKLRNQAKLLTPDKGDSAVRDRLRRKAGRMSAEPCVRCGEPIPYLAALHSDPYCSRKCCGRDHLVGTLRPVDVGPEEPTDQELVAELEQVLSS